MAFRDVIDFYEESDRNRADVLNEPLEYLLQNDNYLKELAERIQADLDTVSNSLGTEYTKTEDLNDLLANGVKGDKGDTGVGLEYNWDGTSLGVKREDEADYTYVDLQGPAGNAGLEETEIQEMINQAVDGIIVPNKVSQLENDEGFIAFSDVRDLKFSDLEIVNDDLSATDLSVNIALILGKMTRGQNLTEYTDGSKFANLSTSINTYLGITTGAYTISITSYLDANAPNMITIQPNNGRSVYRFSYDNKLLFLGNGNYYSTYDNLTQIGLAATCTPIELATALPTYSSIVLTVNANTHTGLELPYTYGSLTLEKLSANYCFFTFKISGGFTSCPLVWYANYYTSSGWSGWKRGSEKAVIEITSGIDLDSCVDFNKVWITKGNAVARACTNIPNSNNLVSFKLEFIETVKNTTTYGLQKLTTYSGEIWTRKCDNGTFGNWCCGSKLVYLNGYWGMGYANNDQAYIRTPYNGLIPYQDTATGDSSSLGTASWQFKNVYAKNIFANGVNLATEITNLKTTSVNGKNDLTSAINGVLGTSYTSSTSYSELVSAINKIPAPQPYLNCIRYGDIESNTSSSSSDTYSVTNLRMIIVSAGYTIRFSLSKTATIVSVNSSAIDTYTMTGSSASRTVNATYAEAILFTEPFTGNIYVIECDNNKGNHVAFIADAVAKTN